LSERYSPLRGRSPTRYSAVRHCPEGPYDLHVLGTPPAFVLSQDQTLHRRSQRAVPCLQRTALFITRVWFSPHHSSIVKVRVHRGVWILLRGGTVLLAQRGAPRSG